MSSAHFAPAFGSFANIKFIISASHASRLKRHRDWTPCAIVAASDLPSSIHMMALSEQSSHSANALSTSALSALAGKTQLASRIANVIVRIILASLSAHAEPPFTSLRFNLPPRPSVAPASYAFCSIASCEYLSAQPLQIPLPSPIPASDVAGAMHTNAPGGSSLSRSNSYSQHKQGCLCPFNMASVHWFKAK